MLGERLVRVTGLHFVILFAEFVVKFSSLKLALLVVELLQRVETVETVETGATEVADFFFSLSVLVLGGRDLDSEDQSDISPGWQLGCFT